MGPRLRDCDLTQGLQMYAIHAVRKEKHLRGLSMIKKLCRVNQFEKVKKTE